MAITASPALNKAVAAAQDVPTLVAEFAAVDPAVAQQIEGKALLASKTPWGTLAVALVAWGAAKYGLGWDTNTDALVGGAGLVLGSYVMRAITNSPISGMFSKTPIAATGLPAPIVAAKS